MMKFAVGRLSEAGAIMAEVKKISKSNDVMGKAILKTAKQLERDSMRLNAAMNEKLKADEDAQDQIGVPVKTD